MGKKYFLSKTNFDTLDSAGTVDIDIGGISNTVTKSADDYYYVPLENATTSADGLMSSEDKTKPRWNRHRR